MIPEVAGSNPGSDSDLLAPPTTDRQIDRHRQDKDRESEAERDSQKYWQAERH